jgi:hypothetical protein
MGIDITSATMVNTLAKMGMTGKTLDDNFRVQNSFKPEDQKYVDQLTAHGFKVNTATGEDIHARVNLLAGLDKYDAEHPMVTPRTNIKPGDLVWPESMGSAYPGFDAAQQQQAKSAQLQSDIFNPSMSVSRINVPGVPNQFVNPIPTDQQAGFNAWASQFGQALAGNTGLSLGGAGMGGPPVAPPTATAKPPTPVVPPPPKPDKPADVPGLPGAGGTAGGGVPTVNAQTGFVTGGTKSTATTPSRPRQNPYL